jgi:hypothetical protein
MPAVAIAGRHSNVSLAAAYGCWLVKLLVLPLSMLLRYICVHGLVQHAYLLQHRLRLL